mgnify:FL=1
MVHLGKRLRDLRIEHGWKQADLASKLNVSTTVISNYETEVKIPKIDTLCEMARLFGVSTDSLLGVEERRMISIEGLTKRQQEIVTTMIIEFRSERKAGVKRLTTRQTDIIRDYIFEITSDR